jgi:RNA polymerase primary sigma factor
MSPVKSRSRPVSQASTVTNTTRQQQRLEHHKQRLLSLQRENGFLTLADLVRAVAANPDELEELRDILDDAGVELVERDDEIPWEQAAAVEQVEDERVASAEMVEDSVGLSPFATIQVEEYAPETSAAIYLRDISRVPLLTAAEEVSLSKTFESGRDARRQILDGGHHTPEARESLVAIVTRGEEARRRLTESNLRLVVSVARKYMGRGLPLLDLIQEGNIGLGRAVEKFDWRKGYRFSTYAYWWIRQAVTRSIADQARTVRVPVHMIEAIGHLFTASRELQQALNREPTRDELAARLNMTPDKIDQIVSAAKQPISLETPIGQEEDSTIADLIADRNVHGPSDAASASLLKDYLDEAFRSILTPRERKVIRMRYGLEDGRERTLSEIADALGVSRERVRQIEGESLGKLRRPGLRQKLREYID